MKDCYYSKYEPIFGSWHITGEIGSGAEGHLFRIRREDALGHVFYSALKAVTIPAAGEAEIDSLIGAGMSEDEAAAFFNGLVEDAVQEFSLLEKLKGNSNIVSYEDHEIFRHEEGFGWDILIRMEELTPLVSYSIYHQMDESEIIRLGADLCRGLEVCRSFGIVHRDIKPENIFISAVGSYKLGDFGIARIIKESGKSLSRKGTYSYMAPEVYWGKDYDHRVDIYSLGMVMYQYMNDGRMPFMPVYPEPVGYQDGEEAFAKRMCGEPLPEPRNASPELTRIIMKACAHDCEERYYDAAEMLYDLEHLKDGAASSETAEKKGGSLPGTRRKKIIAAVLALAVIAAAAVYWLIPKEVEDIETAGLEDGTEMYIGDELAPEYSVKPDWFRDETVKFTSSDESVLIVDNSGELQAVNPGNAVLTISAKEYSEEIDITVVPKVTGISGIDGSIALTTGNTLKLEPVLSPKEFASEPVEFRTEDEKIASVTEDGTLTAVSAGETKLTVASGGTSITSTVTVADPVVYRAPSQSKKSSGSKKKSSSGGSSKGYFDSSDDESF